jgi:hypothetical protein
MMPEMTFVDSSNIEAIGYDIENAELHVRFIKGGTYVIRGVPQDVYDGLMSADSKGSYYNRFIKPNYPDVSKI